MKSTELKQGSSYVFEVIKEKSQNNLFFVKTDDDLEFSFYKFKFQRNKPIPDTVTCYVKSLYPSISLGQDISVYINEFYKEGEDYNFIVKDIRRDSDIQYELKDEYGLSFNLYSSPVPLSKGKRVKCKVVKIKGAYVNLKYVGSLGTRYSLEYHTIDQWVEILGLEKYPAEYYLKLFEAVPEFAPAIEKYYNKVPGWTLDLLQLCTQHITEWLVECKDNLKQLRRISNRLEIARKLALYMLEESDFLRSCSIEHRQMLQNKLSNYVELFEQYKTAASKILDQTHEEYIDNIFQKLKEAGYLYKPSRQIRIMMTILKLRPELINTRMGELFEALHNWNITNWQTEPFRDALVQQLQIFIEENKMKVNSLAANDSSKDNKLISRMILAIAIQRLLATESDNIDYNLNRAMLYRYISYLYPNDIEVLLDKGIDSLLGLETPNEYSWDDTENPTLLSMKSSHPNNIGEEKEVAVKSYMTSKAELQLRSNGIHIIAKDADPDSTVIPNDMFEWLNPTISLNDQLNLKYNKKTKDLKTLKNIWDSISWSLFGEEASAGEHIEKLVPDVGDEVKIIIDDVRILNTGHEKQRLQFHCTITDDLYYGDGWMPCDAFHMIPWLTYKDIPGNYDGTVDFATDEDGEPLEYLATVQRGKEGDIIFSMKSQIDDFLIENSFPGEESIAIITYLDRINNVWLCLSETGATYKVACDETTSHLSEGMLVRVKYIETDNSTTTSQFFIGELAEDQSNLPTLIKKSECLCNLMQSLGMPMNDEKPYQVMESEQVMSEAELLELIYFLQRRAFSESEYMKAYNYLGLSTVLCRLAEKPKLLKELSLHMELLEFLQDFGRNKKLDREALESYEEKVNFSPMLERLYTRLKIVSGIDWGENAQWLWEKHQNPRNETEGKLASLVLSYNMLPKDLETSRKQILTQISNLLNINSTASTSKYYGDESQTVEFKSSLVYSSKGGSRPSPKEQLFEITHIVCGFMNARGGKLFIGVNDSGYENGLDDDLTFRKSRGERSSIDAMIVDLQNHFDRVLPTHSKGHWEISSDPESKKGVIVIEVKPVRQPVELDGVIYVRASSTTKPRLNDEREEFIKTRDHNYNLLMALWGIKDESGNDETIESENIVNKDEPNKIDNSENTIINFEEDVIPDVVQDESDENKIRTGEHRLNVLHDYEPNYAAPSFYIYFTGDNSLWVSKEDQYMEHQPECRLVLAVKEDETDGFMVVTDGNSKIGKISVAEIGNLPHNQTKEILQENKIVFSDLADSSDYLLSVLKTSFGGLFYRLDNIDNIQPIDGKEGLKNICDHPHKIIVQEIVSKDKKDLFDKDSINREYNFYGTPLPVGDGTLSESERITELLRPVRALEL